MNKNVKSHILIIVLLLSLAGCISPISNDYEFNEKLPESFDSRKDSLNIANINWRQYFNNDALNSLLDSALKNNFQLNSTLQNIKSAKANLMYNNGLKVPEVRLAASAGQQKESENNHDWSPDDKQSSTNNDFYLGLQTSWEIDIWGKIKHLNHASEQRYLASIEGMNWLVTNLVADISFSYFKLISLDNRLDIIKKNIETQENALEIVKAKKMAGVENELVVKQFEAQLYNIYALEKTVLQDIELAENNVNLLLARYPQPISRMESNFIDPFENHPMVGSPSDLLVNRADIREAVNNLNASIATIESSKAAFYPSFSINAGVGYNSQKPANFFTTPQSMIYNIFGNLTAPILNRSSLNADYYQANAEYNIAKINYDNSVMTAYYEVKNELIKLQQLENLIVLKNKQVEKLSESIDISIDLFKTGHATYLEVLFAQQSSLEVQLELNEIKNEQFSSYVYLYKVLGGGWE